MKTPLQVIADFGCPTDSAVFAIKHLSERDDLTIDEYRKGIQDIVGLDELPEIESYYHAYLLFRYIVQETIKAYNTGIIPLMEHVYIVAQHKAVNYIQENPWAQMVFEIQHGLFKPEEEIDGVKFIATQQGDKKQITERLFKEMKAANKSRQEIINAFVEQTGMSKAGATTYFHSLKKELGFKETPSDTKQAKPQSKQELADQLYQEAEDKSKPALIALFTEKLQTSKLGAQTYYYSCKKKFDGK
jgi:hypothetical protein